MPDKQPSSESTVHASGSEPLQGVLVAGFATEYETIGRRWLGEPLETTTG